VRRLPFLVFSLLLSASVLAAVPVSPNRNELHDGVSFRIAPGRPDAVAAFYEARGFPPPAIRALRESCFLSVVIRNQRSDVVWLELDRWRFIDDTGRAVERLARPYWDARWDRLGLPATNRATFGWTQLPEQRDLRPDEPVGGNVLVTPPPGRFRLEARFATGVNKSGPEIVVRVDDLICPTVSVEPAP
jgi:hypothetical protein